MTFDSDKTMFEIYRDCGYDRIFHVVYFTELHEYNKELEINRALAGEHFLDGYISDRHISEAKQMIEVLLERLNSGESVTPADAREALVTYLV